MSYTVSENVKNIVKAITDMAAVQSGLEFIKNEEDEQIRQQCELVVIEAPTGDEGDRAVWMVERFKELGLEDCHIDRHGYLPASVSMAKGDSATACMISMERESDRTFLPLFFT